MRYVASKLTRLDRWRPLQEEYTDLYIESIKPMKYIASFVFAFMGIVSLLWLYRLQSKGDTVIITRDVLLLFGWYIALCFIGPDQVKEIIIKVIDKVENMQLTLWSKKPK